MKPRAQEIAEALTTLGYVVVDQLVERARLSAVEAELRPHFANVSPERRHNATARIHSRVVGSAPQLQRLLIEPLILDVLDLVLGPNCVKYQLSSVQGIEVHPGAGDQGLHRDDDIFRLPHPHPVFEVNVMWAITDFRIENGATRVVPGSHAWPSGQTPKLHSETAAAMPGGSALLWLGSTWHGAGANRSTHPRMGVYAGYSLGWLRQEESMTLALPPEVARAFREPLQRLVGYELKGTHTLGWLDGRDPRDVLGLDSSH